MSWVDGLRHRLHVWSDRNAYFQEQQEERRFHREMELMHWRAGDARPGSDRASATNPSGLIHRQRERSKVKRFLDGLRQDFGYAVRGLIRSPGFALMAVATLALGVGANAAVFSVLDRLFGQPPAGLGEPEDLRRLYLRIVDHSADPEVIAPSFNYPAYSAVESAVEPGVGLAAWTPSSEQFLRSGDGEVPIRASWVTHDYFDVLNVSTARGRLFGEEEGRVDVHVPVAVISHDFWKQFFGSDPSVLGRSLDIDGTDYTVVGVAADGFTGLDLNYTDVFLPLGTLPVQTWSGDPWWETGGNYLQVASRVGEGVGDEQLAARATAGYHRQVVPERYQVLSTTVVVPGSIIAARGVGARAGTAHANQAVSLSMRIAGVSAIVLLIAAANVAGLLLVRASRRRHELAVRRALGISRARLMSQFLTEGMVLTALAAAAAVPVAGWGGAALRRLLLPEVQWARGPLDMRAILFALGSAVVVGLLAAMMPALQPWGGRLGTGLKVTAREGGGRGAGLRSALLAGPAALAVILLMGAGLFVRSLDNVSSLRLGFDIDELVMISIRTSPAPAGPELREVASRLTAMPGVTGAAMAMLAPMSGSAYGRLFLPGRDSLLVNPDASPAYNTVSPEFFQVTGMRVLDGRTFAPGESQAVMVSQTMARVFWPGENATEKCIVIGEPDSACQPVIGVVEDSRRRAIIEEPMPHYFLPLDPDAPGRLILLRVQPGQWDAAANAVREELGARYEPREVMIRRSTELLEPQFRPWRLGAQLFTAFGLLALLVTIVGVYSVMAYAVSQRTHEMGVRMALGARMHDILGLVVGSGIRVVAAGVVIGIAVSLALGRVVESLLYDVSPWDPVAMAWAAGILLA
ncbi:MAG: ABC transporter permease, partial [Gemmatimonadota bacterium]